MVQTTPFAVGIIGLGRAGLRRYKALQADPVVRVVWGADPALDDITPETQFSDSMQLFQDPAEALALAPVDALVISTPPALHARLVTDALDCGIRNFLVEKPLTCSAAAARHLEQVLEGRNGYLKVGANLRHFPEIKALAEVIAEGTLGRIMKVVLSIGHDGKSLPGWGEQVALAGGGTLLDNGVHILDLAAWMGLVPDQAELSASLIEGSPGVDLHCEWEYRTSDYTGSFSSSWQRTDGIYFEAEIQGEAATATLAVGRVSEPLTVMRNGVAEYPAIPEGGDSWGDDTRSFVRALTTGAPAGPAVTEAATVLARVEDIYYAARLRG
jgi:predicted dehydrogenase